MVVNTIALWNTRYRDEDIERLSPLVHEHINLHGRYYFGLAEAVQRGTLLRSPRNPRDAIQEL